MKIKNILEEERPRERLIKHGPNVLSSSELLAILLGKSSRKENVIEISQKILSEYNFNELSILNVNDLKKFFGIGNAKACQIVACFELGRRAGSFSPEKKRIISSAKDVNNLFCSMGNLKKEQLEVLFIGSGKQLISSETVFVGSLNSMVVHPREIFNLAIQNNAAAIVLIHNHPSGDCSPSEGDLEITRQLISAGTILDIDVLDHVIIGGGDYYSMREKENLWVNL